ERDQEASHWFQGILYKDPNHLPTLNALADYYAKKGKSRMAGYYRRKADKARLATNTTETLPKKPPAANLGNCRRSQISVLLPVTRKTGQKTFKFFLKLHLGFDHNTVVCRWRMP